MDKEALVLAANPFGGLGCDGNSEYYGGQVHFSMKVKGDPKKLSSTLTWAPERPELGPSTRFTRRFGSSAFIKLNIHKDLLRCPNLITELLRPIIIIGRVFRAFYSKDKNVFLKKTNERYVDGEVLDPVNPEDLVDGQGSLIDFLNWHNPLALNFAQVG